MDAPTADPNAILADFLSPEELGAQLRKTPRSLSQWRRTKQGPPYVKIGNTVLYQRAAVSAWLLAQTVRS